MTWDTYLSSELIDVRDGTHDSPSYVQDGYPLITSKNLVKGSINFDDVNLVSEEDYHAINKRSKVDIGDILYSMIGSIGNYAYVTEEPNFAIKNVALFKFEDTRLYAPFFLHMLNSPIVVRQIESSMKGGTQKFITLKILRNLKIPLPPLPVQQKIAAILDEADKLRQLNKQFISKYDELTQSLFLEMFEDPVTNPKGMKTVTLNEITSKITDGVHAKPEYTEEGIEFISVKDITTGELRFGKCKYISEEAHKKYFKRCNPEYLDILYTKVGATYGRPVIVDVKQEFSLYVSVALIKPLKNLINPFFLKEAMGNVAVKRQADRSIKGIGVPDLHLNMIKKFIIPLPDMKLQNQFAERVRAIESQKAQAQQGLEKAEELFKSLLQRAFKGELV